MRISDLRPRAGAPHRPECTRYVLSLADGWKLGLRADDARASVFLDRFARAAGLPRAAVGRSSRTIQVKFDDRRNPVSDGRICRLSPIASPSEFFCHAVELTMTIGRNIQARGGVFLHGALAAYRGKGVVLAAPGGTGKTTASGRLPGPWRSLCDDMTLIVRSRAGRIWAHPWPTLSRFLDGGPGGKWNAARSVPLSAVCFLLQAPSEEILPVGPGEGLALLVESSEQASHAMVRRMGPAERRALRRERFVNLAVIARTVPVHLLNLSLKGEFWKEIEKVLRTGSSQPRVRRSRPSFLLR